MASRSIDQLTPEEVRRKWDSLLEVINNVATGTNVGDGVEAVSAAAGGPVAHKGASHSGSQVQHARELLAGSSMSSGKAPSRTKTGGGRARWDDRHHLVYSTVNDKMQKNVRAYFDRPREIEAFGTRYDAPLRTIWQLNTPTEPPPPGSKVPMSPMSAENLQKKQMQRSLSSPSMQHAPGSPEYLEAKWDTRHSTLFTKDNHHYHCNLRDYFERPRHLLY